MINVLSIARVLLKKEFGFGDQISLEIFDKLQRKLSPNRGVSSTCVWFFTLITHSKFHQVALPST